MSAENNITILNQFLNIQKERFANFEINILETKELDLKSLLYSYQEKCKACKLDLTNEIIKLGGNTIQEDNVSLKKMIHLWLDFKNVFINTNREDLLYICEYNEYLSVKKFRNLLENNIHNLSQLQIQMLKKQLVLLQNNHDHLKVRGEILLKENHIYTHNPKTQIFQFF